MRPDHQPALRMRLETILRRSYPGWLSTRVLSVRVHCSLSGAWKQLHAMERQGAVESRQFGRHELEWREI